MSERAGVHDEAGTAPERLRASNFAWGFVSQGASSATNFALSLVAARKLGPQGLGLVFIGFSAYLIAVGFQRALVTNPLISTSSALTKTAQAQATRSALLLCMIFASLVASILAVAQLVLDNDVGRGLVLILPWIVPALIQDFWRVVLYRDRRSSGGALNDLLWLIAMVVALPLVLLTRSPWIVVTWWGLGALTGMGAGFFQTGLLPARPAAAIRWWRVDAWPLARWLLAGGAVYSAGTQIFIFLLASIVGTRGLGGLRAGEAVFAPLSVLGPALALPGLPSLTRRAAVSRAQAKKLAIRLSAIALSLTGPYVLIAVLGGEHLLSLVFGRSFGAFHQLVFPIGLGQMLIAPTLGFTLLLVAEKRGKGILIAQAVESIVTLVVGILLANKFGALGAAWGMAIGSGIEAIMLTLLALEVRMAKEAWWRALPKMLRSRR